MLKFLFWNIKRKGDSITDVLHKISSDIDVLIVAELMESKSSLIRQGKNAGDIIQNISDKTNMVYVSKNDYSWLHVWKSKKENLEVNYIDKYDAMQAPKDLVDKNSDDSEYFTDYLNRFERMLFFNVSYNEIDFLLVPIHFPSRIYASVTKQKDISVHFKKYIEAIETKLGLQSLVVGDFNMNPFEPGMLHQEGFHALPTQLLDSEISYYSIPYKTFYNPTWQKFGDYEIINEEFSIRPGGTFYYDNSSDLNYYWYIFDQVIMRKEIIKHFSFKDFKIIRGLTQNSEFIKNNIPNGEVYSDHLPLTFTIKNN